MELVLNKSLFSVITFIGIISSFFSQNRQSCTTFISTLFKAPEASDMLTQKIHGLCAVVVKIESGTLT